MSGQDSDPVDEHPEVGKVALDMLDDQQDVVIARQVSLDLRQAAFALRQARAGDSHDGVALGEQPCTERLPELGRVTKEHHSPVGSAMSGDLGSLGHSTSPSAMPGYSTNAVGRSFSCRK